MDQNNWKDVVGCHYFLQINKNYTKKKKKTNGKKVDKMCLKQSFCLKKKNKNENNKGKIKIKDAIT